MRSSKAMLTAVLVCCASAAALAQGPTYRFGTTPSDEQIKARDTAVSPGGRELPPGSGTAKDGATVYTQKCALCHRPNGTGTKLHRGLIPLGNAKPVKIEGSLVPYATTVWDFINRAMPWITPGTMTPNEVYAVTAYVLFLNGVIKETDVLDATTLPKVRMPNKDNFLKALAAHPTTAGGLLAGTSSGLIYRKGDAVSPWVLAATLTGSIRSIVYEGGNPLVAYAAGSAGIVHKTQDGGGTWAPLSMVGLSQ